MKLFDIWKETGYTPTLAKMMEYIDSKGLEYTPLEVKKFLKEQPVLEIYKQTTKPREKEYSSVVAPSVGSNLQIDLMDYDRYSVNKSKYILMAIDIHSRYAVAVPLTSKYEHPVIEGMKKVFKKLNYIPEIIQCDNGGEFTGALFKQEMQKKGVKEIWYSQVGDPRKNSIVERLNRTIANMLQRFMTVRKSRYWTDFLEEVMTAYNNTHHRTIDAKPYDVWYGIDFNKQIPKILPSDDSFNIGDTVRIKRIKKATEKGDINKFSRDIYKIVRKVGNKYELQNNKGDVLKALKGSLELMKVDNTTEAEEEPEEQPATTRRKITEPKDKESEEIRKRKATKRELQLLDAIDKELDINQPRKLRNRK